MALIYLASTLRVGVGAFSLFSPRSTHVNGDRMSGINLSLQCDDMIVPTNRAAGRVRQHSTGLTPSIRYTGEDLAPMMPDRRRAFHRAATVPSQAPRTAASKAGC